MRQPCQICSGKGTYEFGRHADGYFIVEVFTCPCEGNHQLVERNYFAQTNPWPFAVGITGLFLICAILV
jgi:hypothetical protein